MFNISQLLEKESFIEKYRENNKDFTRNRKLTFKRTVFFPCFFNQSNLQNELDLYFGKQSDELIPGRYVDKSAYTHARKKYKAEVYHSLNKAFTDGYYKIPEMEKTFHGFRVYGVDGSLIDLPSETEIVGTFGVWHSRNGNSGPRGRISTLYDCMNEISLDFRLVPKSTGERDLAIQHLENIHALLNQITLYDRGYASIILQKIHLIKNSHFCMRMPTTWKLVKEFIEDKTSGDKVVTVHPGHLCRKECIERGLTPQSYQIRLVKIVLPSGAAEVLATSLFSEKYDICFFKELYNLRWNTEENYKSAKCKVKIEKFTGKTVKAVYQETYARMFMLNIAACLKTITQKTLISKQKNKKKKKYEYKIAFKAVLSKIKNYGTELFLGSIEKINRLVSLILPNNDPVRPGRTYERKKKNVKGYFMIYSDI